MKYTKQLNSLLEKFNGKGVFVTAGKKPNTMTASWGFCGVMWSKPILIMPIRKSRFTHNFILNEKEFCVSIPLDNDMNKLLSYFGTTSGRDKDKYNEQNIFPVKCKNIDTFFIPGNCLQFECKVILANDLNNLDNNSKNKYYSDNDYHTMFYGEIIDVYKTIL